MCFSFLLFETLSEEIKIEAISFAEYNITSQDKIIVDHQDHSLSAYFFWNKNNNDIKGTFTTTNSSGGVSTLIFDTTGTAEFNGLTTEATFNDSCVLQVWVIPSGYCDGPSLLYSTEKYLSDSFYLQKPTTGQTCLFFDHMPQSTHFYMAIKSNGKVFPSIELLTPQNKALLNVSICKEQQCHGDIAVPFFATINNLDTESSVNFDYTFPEKQESECTRVVIPDVYNGAITEHGFMTKWEEVVCTAPFIDLDNEVHLIVLASIFITSIILFVVLYFCGCCSHVSNKLNEAINKGPDVVEMRDDLVDNEMIDIEGAGLEDDSSDAHNM